MVLRATKKYQSFEAEKKVILFMVGQLRPYAPPPLRA